MNRYGQIDDRLTIPGPSIDAFEREGLGAASPLILRKKRADQPKPIRAHM